MKLGVTIITALVMTNSANAIDASQKIAQHRPDNLNTSTIWTGHALSASYTTDEPSVPLNKIHTWRFKLTSKDGKPIEDAEIILSVDMPEHLHGMTTKPKVSKVEIPGQYLVEGMNFHMPGWWEITLDISKGRSRNLVRFNLIVGEGLPMKEVDHMMERGHMKMNNGSSQKKHRWQGC